MGWLRHCGQGCPHSIANNYVSIRRADAGEMLPVNAMHSGSALEFAMESDLSLPGEWRSNDGAVVIPPKTWPSVSQLPSKWKFFWQIVDD